MQFHLRPEADEQAGEHDEQDVTGIEKHHKTSLNLDREAAGSFKANLPTGGR
jgi:hypothetical protein